MTKRKSFTAAQRAKIFLAANGMCHLCSRKIGPGETWEVEHTKALGLGGTNDAVKPAHVDCHKPKTKRDVAIMRAADRQAKSHLNLKAPRQKIQSRGFPKSNRRKALWTQVETGE